MTKTLHWLWIAFLVMGIAGLAGRIVLVEWGILYGAPAVSRVDGIVAGTLGLSLAFFSFWRSRKKAAAGAAATSAQSAAPDQSAKLSDRVGALAALVSAAALVVSGVNLFVPIDHSGLAAATCAGGHTLAAKYVGITSGTGGDNSRSGPARYYPANGRFAENCSLGFSGYCIGEALVDPSGSNSHQVWLTSRWLLVAKQPGGWRSFLARYLSGENQEPQFITDANVTPATDYEDLPPAGAVCSKAFSAPSRATLKPFNPSQQTLTAQADHAVNIGFAVWIPPGQGFRNPGSYQQIYNPQFNADQNPGQASPDGTKSVSWAYHSSLLTQLLSNRAGGAHAAADVVVMAIPCLADNLPADPATAATATYDIASESSPILKSPIRSGFQAQLLAHAACQADT